MKHSGKALQAGLQMILWALGGLLLLGLVGLLGSVVGRFIAAIAGVLFGLWCVFALFCLWFFRDPEPLVPAGPGLFVSPATGKVDVTDEMTEAEFLAGPCRRVSIFLSVFDVHVQRSPVAGRLAYVRRHPGQFLNAMRLDSAAVNENVYLGLESADLPQERVGVRLIAGLIARRIVPWVATGDTVDRGDHLSLIRFGSRVDLYLPLTAKLQVRRGDRVKGGETVIATRG